MKENICNELKSKHCVLWVFSFFCLYALLFLKTTNKNARQVAQEWQASCKGRGRLGQCTLLPVVIAFLFFGTLPMAFQFDLSQEKDIKFNLSSFFSFKIIFSYCREQKKTRASKRTTLKALKHRQYCGFRFTVWLLFAKEIIIANSIF